MTKNTNFTINPVRPELVEGWQSAIVRHSPPVNSSVIPAQAGIHNAVQMTQSPSIIQKHSPMDRSGGRTLVRHCSTKVAPPTFKNILQSGFTLLEMVLVLFLIGLMASATLILTENVEDQAKYDETKRRMAMMRKAIVGDPTRTVNGGPEISGFVADMGRLPLCVAELLELGPERLPTEDPRAYDSPCDASKITAFDLDLSTGLGSGWRGPYIQVLSERNGDLRFRDGYGNSDASDAVNSGWSYDVSTATGTISLVSKGFDPVGSTDLITENQLVVSADWQVELPATVNIAFKNQSAGDLPTADEDLMLLIYAFGLSLDASSAVLTLNASSAIASSLKTKNFTLNTSPNITIGSKAYAIVCDEIYPTGNPVTNNPEDFIVFDGDCATDNPEQSTSNIRIFSVTPRQSLNLNLDWIIQ